MRTRTVVHHDLIVLYEGSICLVVAHGEALAWLRETAPEDAQWWSGSLVVEPRYVDDIINARADALGVDPED